MSEKSNNDNPSNSTKKVQSSGSSGSSFSYIASVLPSSPTIIVGGLLAFIGVGTLASLIYRRNNARSQVHQAQSHKGPSQHHKKNVQKSNSEPQQTKSSQSKVGSSDSSHSVNHNSISNSDSSRVDQSGISLINRASVIHERAKKRRALLAQLKALQTESILEATNPTVPSNNLSTSTGSHSRDNGSLTNTPATSLWSSMAQVNPEPPRVLGLSSSSSQGFNGFSSLSSSEGPQSNFSIINSYSRNNQNKSNNSNNNNNNDNDMNRVNVDSPLVGRYQASSPIQVRLMLFIIFLLLYIINQTMDISGSIPISLFSFIALYFILDTPNSFNFMLSSSSNQIRSKLFQSQQNENSFNQNQTNGKDEVSHQHNNESNSNNNNNNQASYPSLSIHESSSYSRVSYSNGTSNNNTFTPIIHTKFYTNKQHESESSSKYTENDFDQKKNLNNNENSFISGRVMIESETTFTENEENQILTNEDSDLTKETLSMDDKDKRVVIPSKLDEKEKAESSSSKGLPRPLEKELSELPASLDFGESRPLLYIEPSQFNKDFKMKLACTAQFGLSADAFFHLFLSDRALFSFEEFHKVRPNEVDYKSSLWKDEGEGTFTRDLSLLVPIVGAPFGPDKTRVFKSQKKIFTDDKHRNFLINTIHSTLDVPFGDCFLISDSWQVKNEITPSSQTANKPNCTLTIYCGLKYLKQPFKIMMFKSLIESRSFSDMQASFNDWIKLAQNFLNENQELVQQLNQRFPYLN